MHIDHAVQCVVAGCSNDPDPENGIFLHKIPFADDHRPVAKKRRKNWVDFVKTKRAKWEPMSSSCVCSVHFKEADFERRFPTGNETYRVLRLKTDETGIIPAPSINRKEELSEPSERALRGVRRKV